jgi:hypothetical protein
MWSTAAGLEEARKWGRERIRLKRRKRMGWRRKGSRSLLGPDILYQSMFPMTYFLPLGPISDVSIISKNVLKFLIHQWINLLRQSEPSWSSHFSKPHL